MTEVFSVYEKECKEIFNYYCHGANSYAGFVVERLRSNFIPNGRGKRLNRRTKNILTFCKQTDYKRNERNRPNVQQGG